MVGGKSDEVWDDGRKEAGGQQHNRQKFGGSFNVQLSERGDQGRLGRLWCGFGGATAQVLEGLRRTALKGSLAH